jgi:hypothetical protein
MKKSIFFIFLFFAFIGCKINEKKATPLTVQEKQLASTDTANFTTIKWVDSIFKDVGKVKKGQTVEITYRLENSGDKPLIISDVRPGCGCTLAEKPEQAIAPGKEGKIVAKFNTATQAVGSHTKNITVQGNFKPTGQAMLMFKADVVE